MPIAIGNGININYEQTGAGPHLVLIHGLSGSLKTWKSAIVPGLSDAFTVLTYDLRGHGRSDMPLSGYTSADMAYDLSGLLDDRGIECAHIVGHSIGGVTALHFTALYPSRVVRLTVSDCRVRTFQPQQKVKDWPHWTTWRTQLEQHGLTVDGESELDFGLLASLMPQPAPASDEAPREGGRASRWDRLMSETTAGNDLKDPAGLTSEMIEAIQCPVQGIFGELSFCLPTLERLRELLPDLKAEVLPGAGHLFPIMRPALFIKHVKAFHSELGDVMSDSAGAEATEALQRGVAPATETEQAEPPRPFTAPSEP